MVMADPNKYIGAFFLFLTNRKYLFIYAFRKRINLQCKRPEGNDFCRQIDGAHENS